MIKNTFFLLLLAALPGAADCRAGNPHAGEFYVSGDREKAQFALTFDDGPGFITEDLLKLLGKHGVRATFFMLGSSARKHPARARLVAEAGHLVASHTDSHLNWFATGRSTDKVKILSGELEKAAVSIEKAAGVRPWMLRMPNGYDRPWVRRAASKRGYTLVNWTYGGDWLKATEEKITARYLAALKPGAILLLHDGGGKAKKKNLRIVKKLLFEAGKRGLKPVRVDELLGLPVPAKQ